MGVTISILRKQKLKHRKFNDSLLKAHGQQTNQEGVLAPKSQSHRITGSTRGQTQVISTAPAILACYQLKETGSSGSFVSQS